MCEKQRELGAENREISENSTRKETSFIVYLIIRRLWDYLVKTTIKQSVMNVI